MFPKWLTTAFTRGGAVPAEREVEVEGAAEHDAFDEKAPDRVEADPEGGVRRIYTFAPPPEIET
jgi:hypothetical protein